MSGFIGYGDIGVWAGNRECEDFLDWFAANRCVVGDARFERCVNHPRYPGCGVELADLIPPGETLGLTGDEYDQAAKKYDAYFAELLGIIETITRGEWKCGVGSKAASYRGHHAAWAFENNAQYYTDNDGLTRDARSSPFPGMNPYLAQHWGDVRLSLVVYASDQLNRVLPKGLVARIDRREIEKTNPHYHPNGKPFITIIDLKADNRIMTIIEFVDPARQRRDTLHQALENRDVSLVEVDLHVGGHKAVVHRRGAWSAPGVVPLSIRNVLPPLSIPLRQTDEDVVLRLQPLVDRAYRMGRYQSLDYLQDSAPPLKGDDAVWADALLRQAGKRK